MLPVNGDGSWEPLLDTEANEWAPAISPDGQWIAYVSDRTGSRAIHVERFPELGGEQVLSRDSGRYLVWSQDGRELFYSMIPDRSSRKFMEDHSPPPESHTPAESGAFERTHGEDEKVFRPGSTNSSASSPTRSRTRTHRGRQFEGVPETS